MEHHTLAPSLVSYKSHDGKRRAVLCDVLTKTPYMPPPSPSKHYAHSMVVCDWLMMHNVH